MIALTLSTIQDGWTALKRASNRGHHKVVEVLLGAGANPNLQNKVSTGQNRILSRWLSFGVHPLRLFCMFLVVCYENILLIMCSLWYNHLNVYCTLLVEHYVEHTVCTNNTMFLSVVNILFYCVCLIAVHEYMCIDVLNLLIQYLILYMYLS